MQKKKPAKRKPAKKKSWKQQADETVPRDFKSRAKFYLKKAMRAG